MVSPTEGQIDEVLNRAFRPQVADSGLWLIREGARRGELGFLADSLLLMDATKRDDGLVCPPGQPVAGSLDFALGTDCLFLIGPTGDDASGGTGLWRFSAQKKTPRPLLSEQREPRQLSVASGRLVVCEGRRQSRLSLWNDWAVVDPAPSAALALSRWEEHQADSLSPALVAQPGSRLARYPGGRSCPLRGSPCSHVTQRGPRRTGRIVCSLAHRGDRDGVGRSAAGAGDGLPHARRGKLSGARRRGRSPGPFCPVSVRTSLVQCGGRVLAGAGGAPG